MKSQSFPWQYSIESLYIYIYIYRLHDFVYWIKHILQEARLFIHAQQPEIGTYKDVALHARSYLEHKFLGRSSFMHVMCVHIAFMSDNANMLYLYYFKRI